jgi:hypothetical protein
MRKIILISFFLFIIPHFAEARFWIPERNPASITGTIQAIGRDYLEILNEDDQLIKRLVYFSGEKKFSVGQRVRVWFDTRDLVVEQIKTMTAVVYKKEGQNAGYLFKSK